MKKELLVHSRSSFFIYTMQQYKIASYIAQYIICIGIGFAFAFGSAIFEVEHWSMAKQTVLHFLLTSVIFLPCALLAGID